MSHVRTKDKCNELAALVTTLYTTRVTNLQIALFLQACFSVTAARLSQPIMEKRHVFVFLFPLSIFISTADGKAEVIFFRRQKIQKTLALVELKKGILGDRVKGGSFPECANLLVTPLGHVESHAL